jgi:low affinity Fe/Cu permease
MRRRIQRFKRWAGKIPPFFRFWAGVFIGGFAGVTITVFAFSAFLFQVLQAITTAILALATVVLALSTLALYRSTRVLAEIEIKRDRRANLRNRIRFAQKILQAPADQFTLNLVASVDGYIQRPEYTSIPIWIRGLRQLINYEDMYADNEIFAILPCLDQLIMRLDLVDNSKRGIEKNSKDQKTVESFVDVLQKNLRILIVKWRGQLPFLYE